MKKFKLTIDVDKINLEKEAHIRNFSQKIKNLAQHCVNFINSVDNETDCSNKRFLPEIHDDDDDSTIDSHCVPTLPAIVYQNKKINYKFFNVGGSVMIPS